jgi:hypothetical protein
MRRGHHAVPRCDCRASAVLQHFYFPHLCIVQVEPPSDQSNLRIAASTCIRDAVLRWDGRGR